MEEYLNIKYSKEEGILGFHRDLIMWARRLSQYPDDYSFKRRIMNSLPSDCLYHLTMYNKLTAEHSSMEDIMRQARHYEQTQASLKVGHNIKRQPSQGSSMPTTSGQQRTVGLCEPQCSRNPPARLPQGRSGASYGMQNQCPALQPTIGNRSRPAAPTPSALKGDTSKLTCYKYGKVGHIASDTKCLQYKKPEQRQIFAAQVLDDRLDSKQPNHMELPKESKEAPEEVKGNLNKEPCEQDNCPEGSQYDDEESSYEEYDGYVLPSDDEEPVYIWAMSTEGGESPSSVLKSERPSPAPKGESSSSTAMKFEDVDWKSCQEMLQNCFQQAPYMGSNLLRSWTPFQFSAIFYHFIPCSWSLVLHSFPHVLLGSPPNHLTSHLMDHLTIPQSDITCHHSAVRSILQHHHLSFSELPAHDAPLRSHQLMMELYLELPCHDLPY